MLCTNSSEQRLMLMGIDIWLILTVNSKFIFKNVLFINVYPQKYNSKDH